MKFLPRQIFLLFFVLLFTTAAAAQGEKATITRSTYLYDGKTYLLNVYTNKGRRVANLLETGDHYQITATTNDTPGDKFSPEEEVNRRFIETVQEEGNQIGKTRKFIEVDDEDEDDKEHSKFEEVDLSGD